MSWETWIRRPGTDYVGARDGNLFFFLDGSPFGLLRPLQGYGI